MQVLSTCKVDQRKLEEKAEKEMLQQKRISINKKKHRLG